MFRRLGGAVLVAVAVTAAAVLIPNGVAATTQSPDLVVHEWGTFTSIAGPDGQAVQWRPLTGPSDLPCFVTLLNSNSIKLPQGGVPAIKATVRMETPVLYFYSASEQTVRASVTFPEGLFSEWYPQATQRRDSKSDIRRLSSLPWTHSMERCAGDAGAKETFPDRAGR
jgi:hypothetical protein